MDQPALPPRPGPRPSTTGREIPHDQIQIGMPLQVTFEHHPDPDGDVYLPLFEPEK